MPLHRKAYPLGDQLEQADLESLQMLSAKGNQVFAVWSGEKRCPKQGEWYLSGAVVEAYRAPNDLAFEYPIATLQRAY